MRGCSFFLGVLLWLVATKIAQSLLKKPVVGIPVVYIIYEDNEIPDYLRVNIEFASRNNHVIVLSNSPYYLVKPYLNPHLELANINEYNSSVAKFGEVYKPHLHSIDGNIITEERMLAEARCFYRWFVLHEFMAKNGIDRVFYGDGDTTVFTNMTKTWSYRNQCSVVINVETQHTPYHWVAAGESSLWTLSGLGDFLNFTTVIYQSRQDVFAIKEELSFIVDMTLLWLWWIAHFDEPNWNAGKSWYSDGNNQIMFEMSFNASKNYMLPYVDRSIFLCNGMDIVRTSFSRTAFDHMHGWKSDSFQFDSYFGIPFTLGACLRGGGKPETLNATEIRLLTRQRIYFNTLHYQGAHSKSKIVQDICGYLRLMILLPSKGRLTIMTIFDETVANLCDLKFFYAGST